MIQGIWTLKIFHFDHFSLPVSCDGVGLLPTTHPVVEGSFNISGNGLIALLTVTLKGQQLTSLYRKNCSM